MAGAANAEINIFSIVLLLILFLNMYRRNGEYLPDQKLFILLIVADALLLALDTLQWVFDGRQGVFSFEMIQISSMFYYLLQALPCLLWCIYVRYEISVDLKYALKAVKYLAIPIALNAILSVLSCFFNIYFYVDNNNFYHRGEYFWIFVILVYSYFFYALIYSLIYRNKTERKIFYSLVLFSLPPLLGSLIQVLHFGLSLSWPGVALSLLIIYINIQKNQLYTDHLTGLYNRRLLDHHLDSCLGKNGGDDVIGVIMLDIDDFKTINDSLGHMMGDRALIETAEILKRSIGKNGFLARYGGDEFVAVVPVDDMSGVEKIIGEIEHNIDQHNGYSGVLYNIRLSIGYDIFKCEGTLSRHDVLSSVDRKMYENKLGTRV